MKSLLALLIFTSCITGGLKSSYSDLYINRHELIAVSYTDRDLSSYNIETNVAKLITDLDRTSDTAKGSVWLSDTSELAVALDGKDRVIAISAVDGSTRDLIADANLNGVLRGMTQLDDGDLLIIETNNIERYSVDGLRRTVGWPLAISSGTQVRNLSNGNFVVCAGGATDQVRIYDINGNLQASNGGPGGHDAKGCDQLKDGRIVVTWFGGSDQIWIYDFDLTNPQVLVLNSNISIMPSPTAVAVSKDNTFYVADTTYNYILEFDASGNFIKKFGNFSNSQDIYVIP